MEIKILTKNRKKLNAAFLIGIVCSIVPWMIIFSIQFFYDKEVFITTSLTLFSFVAFGITLITGLIRLCTNSKIVLKKHSDYVLFINSSHELATITKATQIAYSRNYLKNETLNFSEELTNREAFTILQNKPSDDIKILVNAVKIPFLEQSPTYWLKSLVDFVY